MLNTSEAAQLPPVLPDDVPVRMPQLPQTLVLSTVQQMKALGEAQRVRILGLIQYQPATAKHLADQLGIAPSSVGNHLRVLEAAGLVQIVARRSVRGTIANYYTRTAYFFDVDLPPEIIGTLSQRLDRINQARDELAEASEIRQEQVMHHEEFLHLKLSPARAREYVQRLRELAEHFLREEPDVDGQVYDLYATLFLAPPSLQTAQNPSEPQTEVTKEHQEGDAL